MTKIKELYPVVLIVFMGLLIRLSNIGSIPHGLHNDEASFLLNAVSIYQTGMDEDGNSFPIYLESYIDPKPALYSYLQIPFIAILGPTTTAARLPAVILGTASLLIFFLLLRRLKVDSKLSTLSLIILTLSPWHIILSRGTQEVIMSLFFSLLTLWLTIFLLSSRDKFSTFIFAITSVLSFMLATYSYHSAKIVLPLSLSILTIFLYSHRSSRWISGLITLLIGISLSAFVHFGVAANSDRIKAVSIFEEGGPQLILDEQIRTATDHVSALTLRVYHNKVVNYGLAIVDTYTQHLSPNFFIFEIAQPKRNQVNEHGLLYHIELPLLIIGMFLGLSIIKYRLVSYLLLLWILISPLPSAITTQEIPSSIRSSFMVFPISFYIALSIHRLINYSQHIKNYRYIFGIIIATYIWGMGYFHHQYTIQQPLLRPWNRNVADQVMAKEVANLSKNYNQIIVSRHTGQPYPYLAIENLIDLSILQQSYPDRKESSFTLGKITFVDNLCPISDDLNTLWAIEFNCTLPSEPGYRILNKASYADGNGGYLLVDRIFEDVE